MEDVANPTTPLHSQKLLGKKIHAAITDIITGLFCWEMLLHLAYTDIKNRYRRTVIGPFWTTLNLAIFIGSMGYLFSHLWHSNVREFLPFFSSGFLAWTLLSCLINDSCLTFTTKSDLMKQANLPSSVYAFQVVLRNVMIFLHQFLVFIVIAIFFHIPVNEYTLLVFPGLILLCLNGAWLGIVLGYCCARFRDIQQVVTSLLQISMFVTPIFWPEKQLGTGFKAYLMVNGNPLYHFVSIVRYPLIGQEPHVISWYITVAITIVGWCLAILTVAKYKKQLIFWV